MRKITFFTITMYILHFRIKNSFQVIIVVVLLIVLCVVCGNNIQQIKHRVKRKVMFTSSSKFFFRLNGKANSVNHTEIFAVGYAVRINYDLPSTPKKRFKFFKRDIHDDIAKIPNESVLQGVSCMVKQFCQVLSSMVLTESCGFFCDIGKIIASEEGAEGNFFRSFINKCEHYERMCPEIEDKPHFSFG